MSRAVGASGARSHQRAAWGTVSRDDVVEAALQVVKEGDYEQMTIRSLASRLGVAPMTLYRHVESKDDLLDEVADRLLAECWRPRAKKENWRPWITEACRRLRDVLVGQPAVLYVYLRHPVVSPAAITRMDTMLGVLRQAGLDELTAQQVYASIHTYTIGFAALEASRARWAATDAFTSELERQLASFTTPRQFALGLGHLLDGVERHRQSNTDRPTSP